jgi:polyhydroxybutyrate depolymerase
MRRSAPSLATLALLALATACSGASRPRSAAPLDSGPADASAPPDASRDASEPGDASADLGTALDADAPTDGGGPYPAGATDISLDVGGPRRFRLYVPASLGSDTPRALVVALHGGGGMGLMTSEPGEHPLAVFRDVADRERFVVAFPEGSMAADGRLGWTDCRADNLNASTADDLGFLRAVVARLRSDYALPASRVFMTGTSNGAQMTLAFAALATDDLAALAISSGNLPENPLPGACTTGPSRPLPALFTHGSADPAMPYAGGCVANLGGGCRRGRVIGAEATRDVYLALNGLASTPSSMETVNIDTTDPGPAARFVYGGPVPVEWWRLDGAGHAPPSLAVPVATTMASGAQNRDVEFAELAWAFFAARLP